MGDERGQQDQPDSYEPPRAEDVPSEDGPAVTAAGVTGPPPGPEWQAHDQPEERDD